MKTLLNLSLMLFLCSKVHSQNIRIQVNEKYFVDRDLFSNEIINEGTKSCDAYYHFDLKKNILNFNMKETGISGQKKIIAWDEREGIYCIVYADITQSNSSIVYYPIATIDTINKKVNMVFVERPKELIGIDDFTKFDLIVDSGKNKN